MGDTVRVLSTLALKGAVERLCGDFEAVGGARIDADFAPTLALLQRLRSGEPADVVGGVLYLASPMAAFVTGAVLAIDGGYLIA